MTARAAAAGGVVAVFVGLLTAAVGCAGPDAGAAARVPVAEPRETVVEVPRQPEPDQVLVEARAAMSQADPWRALALLRGVDPARPQATELVTAVRSEAEALARAALKRIDWLHKREQWAEALARIAAISDGMTLDEPLRRELEQRLQRGELAFAEATANLQELDRGTREALDRGDVVQALDSARQGLRLARRLGDGSVVARERVIDVLEHRAPKPAAKEPTRIERAPSKPVRGRAGKNGGKSQGPGSVAAAVVAEGVDEAAAGPGEAVERDADGDQETTEQRVQAALRLAADFQRTRATFNAIVTYLRVLELDPANDTAKVGLQALEEKRRALVAEYLAAANAAFLKEDLRGASPYYRRVLLLEPANEEALKGLQMYYNLERIDREARRK